MPTAYDTPTDTYRNIEALKPRFIDFHRYRDEEGLWNKLVSRELPQSIPATLALTQDGIDFQSPDPAKAIQDHVSIIKLNPPHFDYHVPGTSKNSRDLERDHLLTKTTWFNRDINPMRRWESRVGEGLVRHGIKIEQLCARRCPDPTDGEEMRYDSSPNYFKNTLLDGCYWTNEGDEDPGSADEFIYQYSVPVYGSNITNQEGKRLTLDSLGNLGYLGPEENHDYSLTNTKTIQITIADCRDLIGICPLKGCDHPMRRITVYACPGTGSNFSDKAEQIESYQSPFPGCSFFIIGGHMFQTERDPDRIYRPLMEGMYTLQAWLNLLITWHTVLAFQEANDAGLYGNLARNNPAQMAAMTTGEDSPANTTKMTETAEDEIPLYNFSIERMPKKSSAEVMVLINRCLDMMQEHKPNRFQTGLNYTEASNATASANLAALQQSGIIYSPLLDEIAGAINKWDYYTDHQIRWYSYLEPDNQNTKYYATVSGEADRTYGTSVRRGETVFLDAKKCDIGKDLVVSIENLTWAEKQAKWYLSLSQYQAGVKTVAQLIRDSGVFDVISQTRELQRDQFRQSLTPLLIRMEDMLMTKQASIDTGFDFGQLMQQVVPQQGPQQPPQPDNGSAPNAPNTAAANVARQEVTLPPRATPAGMAT